MRGTSIAAVVVMSAVAGCGLGGSGLDAWDDASGPNQPIVTDTDEPPRAPPPKGPQPEFGPVRSNPKAPALSGGTLLLTKDKLRLVAADPDRDQIYVVTLANRKVVTIPLTASDEPGRLAEDASGHVHVALRRGGAVVSIDPVAGTVLARRAICPAPRGIASDDARKRLLVACEGGELFAVPHDTTATATLWAQLGRDLRDVVVTDRIYVSRFRSAHVLAFAATDAPPKGDAIAEAEVAPFDPDRQGTLAWRMIAAPNGTPLVSHQAARVSQVIVSQPGGYGGSSSTFEETDGCSGGAIVDSMLSPGDPNAPAEERPLPRHAVLPVDFAFDGSRIAVVAAGNAHTGGLPQVFVHDDDTGCTSPDGDFTISGQATSIVTLATNRYAVLSREPAQIELLPSHETITLEDSPTSVEDTGHAIFHANSGAGLACASCHGEGGDDGHTWSFETLGPRRTPSLRGTVAGTAPYHWDGEERDIAALAGDVLTQRMNGPRLTVDLAESLRTWLFALPAPLPSSLVDVAAAARGKTVFERSDVGCTSCHGGPRFTSSLSSDVGSGQALQPPSLLGVATHPPFLHDGCASTLLERFTICGSDKHGHTKGLSEAEIGDLVAYLGSL